MLKKITLIVFFIASNYSGAQKVSTIAGKAGVKAFLNGTGTDANFSSPTGLTFDALGNLYVADFGNRLIRKITPEYEVSTFAGSGISGDVDGPVLSAQFTSPYSISTDNAGNFYFTDFILHKVKKISSAGEVSKIGGTGTNSYAEGAPNISKFWNPAGTAVDSKGNIYIADIGNNRIRKITPAGITSTFAGSGASGAADGTAETATFSNPGGIAIDASDNVYVSELGSSKIRKITPLGIVSTVAGTGSSGYVDGPSNVAKFSSPRGIAVTASGVIYVADTNNNRIRKIDLDGTVSTYAGNGTRGFADGNALSSKFNFPYSIVIDNSGSLYVADSENHVIRKITASIPPILETLPVSQENIGSVKAVLQGNIVSSGTEEVTERGIVWSTIENPTNDSSSNKITAGNGTGTFSAEVSSLPPGSLVHFRAYAISGQNTFYGTDLTFTTKDKLKAVITKSSDVSCNAGSDGQAEVTVSGGIEPYSYLWSDNKGSTAAISGLKAGLYSVKITDNEGTEVTAQSVITQPVKLEITLQEQKDVTCAGGTDGAISITAKGGTLPYRYSWTPRGETTSEITGLAAGTYELTLTDNNGCTIIQSYTIKEPELLDAETATTRTTVEGAKDGTASVLVTGGTSPYTYIWYPSGGTDAIAKNLSQGNYTVRIIDNNGCSIIKQITVLGVPDITPPIADIENLPEIINYCEILPAQINVPTATDDTAGKIKATTESPLQYNMPGTYIIKWIYNDGNGNSTAQEQNVKILASPLEQVTFDNQELTYDGNQHSLQVENLPTGAKAEYKIADDSTPFEYPLNAGEYSFKATVSPSSDTSNCPAVTLTAKLKINKATQSINFESLPVRTLQETKTFNLAAVSTSGATVTYTFNYEGEEPAAEVSSDGLVKILNAGKITITASQSGNNNYLPAQDVSQVLMIQNNSSEIPVISVGSANYDNPGKSITYLMDCNENIVNVNFKNIIGALITPAESFIIQADKPGIYTQNATVVSEDGTSVSNYTIKVEKTFDFSDVVHVKHNNILIANNNPNTNGGFEFVAYQWFKNGQLIGNDQYYSAGNNIGDSLDPTAEYMVKLTTKEGDILQTCQSKITLAKNVNAKIFPNPANSGANITVQADIPETESKDITISIYNVEGKLLKSLQSSSAKTEIAIPNEYKGNILIVTVETESTKKTLKLIVK